MEKCFEGFGDVIRHGNVDKFLVNISFNGQSIVGLPFKVHGYFGIFLKIVSEMITVGIVKLFDTKTINAKTILFSLLHCARVL